MKYKLKQKQIRCVKVKKLTMSEKTGENITL